MIVTVIISQQIPILLDILLPSARRGNVTPILFISKMFLAFELGHGSVVQANHANVTGKSALTILVGYYRRTECRGMATLSTGIASNLPLTTRIIGAVPSRVCLASHLRFQGCNSL